ncbi:hypothetical protein EVAR_80050_1 [Eumeta japonica]|uniref:Uncharacterized protein n=1 Tax=Eumeta variegata TaxID=151549 RepID=A0A4C1WPA4_EUMVA|nr:hypothetical protein EVAR_80050_1 [Eumeta japonica]
MKYRWFDFSAEQPQEEPDLIKMARFLEREAERCSAYAHPKPLRNQGDTITQMKRIQKTFLHRRIEENTEPNRSPRPCPVCEKTRHDVTDCETFMKADSNKSGISQKATIFVSNV